MAYARNAQKNADGTKKPSKWGEPQALGSDATLPADAQARIAKLTAAGLDADTLKMAVDAIRAKFTGESAAKAELLVAVDEKTPDLLKIIVGKSDSCFAVAKWRNLIARADFILRSCDQADAILSATK